MIVTSTISPLLKFTLQLIGVWPDVPYSAVRRLIHISSILIVVYFHYLYMFAHFRLSELQNLMEGLPTTLYYSLAIIKASTLWKHHRVIREVLAAVDTDWRECVNVDRHFRLMMAKASISHFCSKVFFGYNTVAAIVFFTANNAIAILHKTQGDNDTLRPFPIKILFPFEAERSPVYELIVIVLFVHAVLVTYTTIIVNTLLFALVLHASGQIDIICEDLKSISEVSYYGSNKRMGILVDKHNKVISFSDNVDKIFSFITLTQVLLNTLLSCALGLLFITSVSGNILSVLKAIFGYFAIIMEIFIFCFVGEHLSFKSTLLADAAYDSLWYMMSPNQSKNMLLVIMRSQKQLAITAGGITTLSLEVFVSIMKASASYMSVVYAMY